MNVRLVSLLQIQRDLYDTPRGFERFQEYLDILRGGTDDMALPLSALNPMGHAHVATTLDHLLTINAEMIAQKAVEEATTRLSEFPQEVQIALVVADDLRGQWTNRILTEMNHLFKMRAELRRGWQTVLCWTSEKWDSCRVHRETLAAVYRAWHFLRHGEACTLSQMMRQEGAALAFAGADIPYLDSDDLAYSREVIAGLGDTHDYSLQVAILFGDNAARSVGYEPQGLSDRAGLAVALANQITPAARDHPNESAIVSRSSSSS